MDNIMHIRQRILEHPIIPRSRIRLQLRYRVRLEHRSVKLLPPVARWCEFSSERVRDGVGEGEGRVRGECACCDRAVGQERAVTVSA